MALLIRRTLFSSSTWGYKNHILPKKNNLNLNYKLYQSQSNIFNGDTPHNNNHDFILKDKKINIAPLLKNKKYQDNDYSGKSDEKMYSTTLKACSLLPFISSIFSDTSENDTGYSTDTHINCLEEVLTDESITPELREILEKTLEYVKSQKSWFESDVPKLLKGDTAESTWNDLYRAYSSCKIIYRIAYGYALLILLKQATNSPIKIKLINQYTYDGIESALAEVIYKSTKSILSNDVLCQMAFTETQIGDRRKFKGFVHKNFDYTQFIDQIEDDTISIENTSLKSLECTINYLFSKRKFSPAAVLFEKISFPSFIEKCKFAHCILFRSHSSYEKEFLQNLIWKTSDDKFSKFCSLYYKTVPDTDDYKKISAAIQMNNMGFYLQWTLPQLYYYRKPNQFHPGKYKYRCPHEEIESTTICIEDNHPHKSYVFPGEKKAPDGHNLIAFPLNGTPHDDQPAAWVYHLPDTELAIFGEKTLTVISEAGIVKRIDHLTGEVTNTVELSLECTDEKPSWCPDKVTMENDENSKELIPTKWTNSKYYTNEKERIIYIPYKGKLCEVKLGEVSNIVDL